MITLALAKSHLNISIDNDDDLIQQYIDNAEDRVIKFINGPYNKVIKEELGRGDDSTVEFTADNTPILAHTETLYIKDESAGTLTKQTRDDSYSINYTTGVITFDTAPETGQAPIMSYEYDEDSVTYPAAIKGCVLRLVGLYYSNRSGVKDNEVDNLGSSNYRTETEILQDIVDYRRSPWL